MTATSVRAGARKAEKIGRGVENALRSRLVRPGTEVCARSPAAGIDSNSGRGARVCRISVWCVRRRFDRMKIGHWPRRRATAAAAAATARESVLNAGEMRSSAGPQVTVTTTTFAVFIAACAHCRRLPANRHGHHKTRHTKLVINVIKHRRAAENRLNNARIRRARKKKKTGGHFTDAGSTWKWTQTET